MENSTTNAAALASNPILWPTLIAPRCVMFEGTGLPTIGAVDQRPRTAKLGRPPRGNHC